MLNMSQYGLVKNEIPPTPLNKGGNSFLKVPLLKGDLGGSIAGKPLTELY